MELLAFAVLLIGIPGSVASELDVGQDFRFKDSRLHSSASVNTAPQCEKKMSNCACQTDQGLIDLSQIDSKDPTKPKFQDDDRKGEFRYYYNPCTPFDSGQCKGAAMCRCSKVLGKCDVIGIHAKDKFHVEQDKLTIIYSEITTTSLLRSHVSLICGQSDETDADFEYNSAIKNDFYFTLTSLHACPVKKGLSTGSILVITFCCLLFVYFVGGMLFKRCVDDAHGYAMVPHHEFWQDFPAHVRDGIIFTCTSLCEYCA